MNSFRQSSSLSNVATVPLAGMILALVLATIPIAEKVAGWVLFIFAVACIARLALQRPGTRLPPLPVKIILFAACVGGVAMTYGSALGIEPGFSILVVLVSLKLIETNDPRDFHVLALLGFFLVLCDLFFSQDLIRWLYIVFILLLALTMVVLFYRDPVLASTPQSARLALTLLLQSLPLAVLLFLAFPRFYGGFRFQFSQALINTSGMSDELSPGSLSSQVLNDAVAFRVDFPDGNMPRVPEMFWRGGVLWHSEGLRWTPGEALLRERRPGKLTGASILQRISLQPHGAFWLFALDRPFGDVNDAIYLPGTVLRSKRAITKSFHYQVVSRPENHELALPADQRKAALQIPSNVPPRVRTLVDSWKARHPEPLQIVESARRFFGSGHFVYTLQPGTYADGGNGLEDFLFERQKGFCEHYAAAFATLMRVAGIPSRIVIGYRGGEFNSVGKFFVVRQQNAHAWCEVWLKDSGWLRIDPTDLIAADGSTSSLASYLETQAARNGPDTHQSLTFKGWRELQHDLQMVWDNVNYQWDLRVLNFDEEAQHNFLFVLGLSSMSWAGIFIWVLIAAAVFVAVLSLWLRRPRAKAGRIERNYARFCDMLARAGLPRERWEGPQHFAARATQHFPEQANVIEHVATLYIELRYGAGTPSPRPFFEAVRRLPRLTRKSNG